MIERNFANNIIWKEPDGTLLEVAPRNDVFKQEQIANLFNLNFSGGLSGEQQRLFSSLPITVMVKATSTTSTKISLLKKTSSPYRIVRNGSEIASGLDGAEFPFTDSLPTTGTFTYLVEDENGNTDEGTINV